MSSSMETYLMSGGDAKTAKTATDLFRPTCNLRWVTKSRSFEIFRNMESIGMQPVQAEISDNILQQKWICITSGDVEWRDVPIEEEECG